ncbi:MAG TPA: sigma factor-like helix-turn-helix DNA-binding protein [Solirubrobacteraceae bacterium]|nr:sigma factor-like helix-turn-helix DNA-binding protein [Solirubrobacteraceae bacterium]
MGSLDSLPPDQRAVLDLVLQRGRSYDDIASLLAVDRAAVRARALAAFDGIGPDTGLAPESRALITDYLLGQLPEKVAEQTRDRLAELPYERAWARVLASDLQGVASKPLPEIPDGTAQAPASEAPPAPAAASDRTAPEPPPPKLERTRVPRPSDRPSSRLGGVIFLVVGTIVVVAVVLVLIVILSSGSSSKHSSSAPAVASSTNPRSSTTPATGGATSTTSTTGAKIVGQVNLDPPSGSGAAKGVAFLVQAGTALGVIIEATGLAPNSHNAYAVWLSNTPSDSTRVGFVNQAVGKNGKLQTGGPLPANASHFKELLLTRETQNNPKAPGPTILQGALKLPS